MSWQGFCGWVLKKMGWTVDGGAAPEQRCIILGVPHTCIADFLVSYLFYTGIGHKARIMVKQEFFKWPIRKLMKKLGAIPVDRSNGATVIRSVISAVENSEGEFHLCLAPEGTRKPVKRWKMGYHQMAKALNCPVYLGYFDWGTKHIGIGKKFELSDNAREDTDKIQAEYESMHLTAKHPELFITH